LKRRAAEETLNKMTHLIGNMDALKLGRYPEVWTFNYLFMRDTLLALRDESTTSYFNEYDKLSSHSLVVDLGDFSSNAYRWRLSMDPVPTYVVKLVTKAYTSVEDVEGSSLGFFRQMSSISKQTSVVFELRKQACRCTERAVRYHIERFRGERVSVCLRQALPLATQGQAQDVVEVYVNGHGTPIYATVQNDPSSPDSKVHNSELSPGSQHGSRSM
jgi:hypothetical protein